MPLEIQEKLADLKDDVNFWKRDVLSQIAVYEQRGYKYTHPHNLTIIQLADKANLEVNIRLGIDNVRTSIRDLDEFKRQNHIIDDDTSALG